MRQSVVEQRKDYSVIIPVKIHLNFNYFVSMYKLIFLFIMYVYVFFKRSFLNFSGNFSVVDYY